jgi:hypothetical protein
MKIEGLQKYRARTSISELPQPYRWRAEQNLSKMLAAARERGRRIDGWYIAILCGVAKREALNPHTSEWGFSMKQKRAGYASQRRARMEGRDPAARARYFLKLARARRKREKEEAEERKQFQQNQQKANERYIEKISALLSRGKAPFS